MSVGAPSIAQICGNFGPVAVSMSVCARMLYAPKGLERCGWRKNFEHFPQNRRAGASRRFGALPPHIRRLPHGQVYLRMPPIAAGSLRARALAHATRPVAMGTRRVPPGVSIAPLELGCWGRTASQELALLATDLGPSRAGVARAVCRWPTRSACRHPTSLKRSGVK